jgi:hypothetical protein
MMKLDETKRGGTHMTNDNNRYGPMFELKLISESFLDTLVNNMAIDAWASFSGIDPRQAYAIATDGEIHIFAMSATKDTEALRDSLFRLLDLTPLGWNWSLNLEAIETFSLPFMNLLLTFGHHLDLRGGRLTVTGFRVPGNWAAFSDLFQRRCFEHDITWVRCDDNGKQKRDALIPRRWGKAPSRKGCA